MSDRQTTRGKWVAIEEGRVYVCTGDLPLGVALILVNTYREMQGTDRNPDGLLLETNLQL